MNCKALLNIAIEIALYKCCIIIIIIIIKCSLVAWMYFRVRVLFVRCKQVIATFLIYVPTSQLF